MKTLNQQLHYSQKADISVLLKGVHGIGKSERVEAYARERGYHCEVLFLSHQETGDLIGIPYLQDGNTVWSTPIWLKNMQDAHAQGKPCVLFLDELNRARLDVRQSALQLVLSKQIHQHHLPKGTLVVAAINPDDEYQVAELDPALTDRFVEFEIKADVDGWIEWARNKGVNESVVSFIADNPDKLWFKTDSNNESNHPTPRSWVKVSDFLRELESDNLDKSTRNAVLQPFLTGKIGRSIGNQFFSFYKEKSDFNSKSIEDALKKIKNRTKNNIQEGIDILKPLLGSVEVIKLGIIVEDLSKKHLKPNSKLSSNELFEKAYSLMSLLYSLDLEVLHSTLKSFKDGDETKKAWYAEIAKADSIATDTLREKELFRKIVDRIK